MKSANALDSVIDSVGMALQIGHATKEHRFHPKRRWRFDYAWPSVMIALEVEGGVWVKGRHTRGKGYEDDCEKYSVASAMGWVLLRATPGQIKNGKFLEWISLAVQLRKGSVR